MISRILQAKNPNSTPPLNGNISFVNNTLKNVMFLKFLVAIKYAKKKIVTIAVSIPADDYTFSITLFTTGTQTIKKIKNALTILIVDSISELPLYRIYRPKKIKIKPEIYQNLFTNKLN